jgi:CrcB protein
MYAIISKNIGDGVRLNCVMLMTPTDTGKLFVGVFVYTRHYKRGQMRWKKMRQYVFVGLGGIAGAVLRCFLGNIRIYSRIEGFPVNTLIINITGSFLLAFIMTAAFEIHEFDKDTRAGLTAGFFGAYTTFSTLCKESADLITGGYYYPVLLYVLLSSVLGLASVYYGIALAKRSIGEITSKRNKEADNISAALEQQGIEVE